MQDYYIVEKGKGPDKVGYLSEKGMLYSLERYAIENNNDELKELLKKDVKEILKGLKEMDLPFYYEREEPTTFVLMTAVNRKDSLITYVPNWLQAEYKDSTIVFNLEGETYSNLGSLNGIHRGVIVPWSIQNKGGETIIEGQYSQSRIYDLISNADSYKIGISPSELDQATYGKACKDNVDKLTGEAKLALLVNGGFKEIQFEFGIEKNFNKEREKDFDLER